MPTTQAVPFVTLRADEDITDEKKVPWTSLGILWTPDERGIHWAPYGGSMTGEPMFSKVHPIRQKMCMEHPLCQVCGARLDPKRTPWLLNGGSDPQLDSVEIVEKRSFLTVTPPSCERCQDVARLACPHLAEKPTARLLVRKYSVVGVLGDYFEPKKPPEQNITLRFATPGARRALKYFVAKQSVVEIRQYRVLS